MGIDEPGAPGVPVLGDRQDEGGGLQTDGRECLVSKAWLHRCSPLFMAVASARRWSPLLRSLHRWGRRDVKVDPAPRAPRRGARPALRVEDQEPRQLLPLAAHQDLGPPLDLNVERRATTVTPVVQPALDDVWGPAKPRDREWLVLDPKRGATQADELNASAGDPVDPR